MVPSLTTIGHFWLANLGKVSITEIADHFDIESSLVTQYQSSSDWLIWEQTLNQINHSIAINQERLYQDKLDRWAENLSHNAELMLEVETKILETAKASLSSDDEEEIPAYEKINKVSRPLTGLLKAVASLHQSSVTSYENIAAIQELLDTLRT